MQKVTTITAALAAIIEQKEAELAQLRADQEELRRQIKVAKAKQRLRLAEWSEGDCDAGCHRRLNGEVICSCGTVTGKNLNGDLPPLQPCPDCRGGEPWGAQYGNG